MSLNLSLIKTPDGSPAITRDVEWEIARMVQERIFPASRPAIPGLDYFADWRPARGVSGDHIDYFEMSDGKLGLAVGHVASQGLPAALLNPFLHCMLRAWRYARNSSPRELVRNVHEWFYEICPDNCHATLFVATYDPASGELRYVNAGHEPPFVLQKNGEHYRTIFLEASGPVIGMLRRPAYREGVVSLRPGDVLAAYSDGLCETRNRSEERRVGKECQSGGLGLKYIEN